MKWFFDTETTGKAEFRLPANHPSQPRIMQLGGILIDHCGREVLQMDFIIKPDFDASIVSPEAVAKHGISFERAQAEGIPIRSAMNVFLAATMAANSAHAYNAGFDELLIRVESEKLWPGREIFGLKCALLCEMQPMTNICKLPGKYGNQFKWPKLEESFRHAFSREMDNAHNALADVRAMIQVHNWRINLPKA